jgi:hypothetical protein
VTLPPTAADLLRVLVLLAAILALDVLDVLVHATRRKR